MHVLHLLLLFPTLLEKAGSGPIIDDRVDTRDLLIRLTELNELSVT